MINGDIRSAWPGVGLSSHKRKEWPSENAIAGRLHDIDELDAHLRAGRVGIAGITRPNARV
jgi:hypothetical protein